MSEMTVTEHNEKLVAEKAQLQKAIQDQQNYFGLLIAGMMRQMKRKTVTLKAENLTPPGVHLHTKDDGSVELKFLAEAVADGET